jgi:hypothetical protein
MKKVNITMLKDDRGADDGFTIKSYEEGKSYLVGEDLADCFKSTQSAKDAAPVKGDKDGDGKPDPKPVVKPKK